MINIMVHTPVTSRGVIVQYLKKNALKIESKIGGKIKVSSPHDYEEKEHGIESWLENCIKNDNLPDIMLSHASDITVLENYDDIGKYFEPIFKDFYNEHPLQKGLESFVDKDGFFYPLFFICMLLVYNDKKVDASELQGSWKDLFNPKYKSVITSDFKPPSKTLGSYLISKSPELFGDFLKLDRINSPIAIIKQLQKGAYDIGLSHSSFAITGNTDDVGIDYPKEGLGILPQLIMVKKGSDKKLLAVVETLLEEDFKNNLVKLGFVCPQEGVKNDSKLIENIKPWDGYRNFIKSVSDFDSYINEKLVQMEEV